MERRPFSTEITFARTQLPGSTTSSTASTRYCASCEMCTRPCVRYPCSSTNAPNGFVVSTFASWMLPTGGSSALRLSC